jgi:hypothetical protein
MIPFLNGVTACASLLAGLAFLRFYRQTSDRLFMWFAFAFWTLSSHWIALAVAQPPDEARHWFFVLRLAGFVLILVAVAEKNARGR